MLIPVTNNRIVAHIEPSMFGPPSVMWEEFMPRISNELPASVVYLYASEADAIAGAPDGGTGFLVALPAQQDRIYVIANAHVIKDSPFIRVNPRDTSLPFAIFRGKWKCHKKGDDVAACRITSLDLAVHDYQTINLATFVTPALKANLDIGLGEDLFMVGRFINHAGKERNFPTARFGTIASMDNEPIPNIETGYLQDAFLVEIRTIPGYSGSPVFVHIPKERLEREGVRANAEDIKLFKRYGYVEKVLGIEWCRTLDTVSQEYVSSGTFDVHINTGLSAVIPAWKITELLTQMENDDKPRGTRQARPLIEHTGAKQKRKNRDIPIPPISRKKFVEALTKATKRKD